MGRQNVKSHDVLQSALQKARVQDVKTCENELTNIRYPGITADMIGRNVDLLELNLLAVRLTMLSEDDRMGLEGLRRSKESYHPDRMVVKCSAVHCDPDGAQVG